MKLNSEQAQQAWNDYNGFMGSLGGRYKDAAEAELVRRTAKQAFLMGYAIAEAAKVEPGNEPTKVVAAQKREIKKRTPKQIQEDARLVASIMQRHNKPMQLDEITKAVNAAGGEWYKKSASGHMIGIMDIYPTIKKIDRGIYQYVQ